MEKSIDWDSRWKIQVNSNVNKQPQEVVFSRKLEK